MNDKTILDELKKVSEFLCAGHIIYSSEPSGKTFYKANEMLDEIIARLKIENRFGSGRGIACPREAFLEEATIEESQPAGGGGDGIPREGYLTWRFVENDN